MDINDILVYFLKITVELSTRVLCMFTICLGGYQGLFSSDFSISLLREELRSLSATRPVRLCIVQVTTQLEGCPFSHTHTLTYTPTAAAEFSSLGSITTVGGSSAQSLSYGGGTKPERKEIPISFDVFCFCHHPVVLARLPAPFILPPPLERNLFDQLEAWFILLCRGDAVATNST